MALAIDPGDVIGIKMLIVDFYHIPIAISLGVVGGILVLTLLISAWVNHQSRQEESASLAFSAGQQYAADGDVAIEIKKYDAPRKFQHFYASPPANFPYTQPDKHFFTS